MTKSEQALARRAIACEGWRWLPGMRWVDQEHGTEGRIEDDEDAGCFTACPEGELPDLTEPCTLGGLLALVREAWGTRTAWIEPGHDGLWEACVYVGGECRFLESYQTEAEALVAALEAAPVRAGGEE